MTAIGTEADAAKLTALFADLEGKSIHELLAKGDNDLKSMVGLSSGGGILFRLCLSCCMHLISRWIYTIIGSSSAAPAAAAAPAVPEKSKEEEVDALDVSCQQNAIMSLKHAFGATSIKLSTSGSSTISNEIFQSKLNKFIEFSPAKININIPRPDIDRLGIVTEAKQIDEQNIRIVSDRAIFEIIASDEEGCDSHADLTVIEGDLDKMVGQEIVSLVESNDKKFEAFIALYPEYRKDPYGCSNFEVYVFKMKNGELVRILGAHHHNGYYCGGSRMQCENNPNYKAVVDNQARVVLVLGLPASGKTTFCKSHFDDKDFNVLDDALFLAGSEIILSQLLEEGQKVVFCDPRLCNVDTFKKLYEHVVNCVASPLQIAVVYFENNPEQCKRNAHRDNIDLDIQQLAHRYDDTIAYIESLEIGLRHKQNVFA